MRVSGIDYPITSQPCDDGYVNFYSNVNFVSTTNNCNAPSSIHSSTYSKTALADQHQFIEQSGTKLVTISFINNNIKFNKHTLEDNFPTDYTIWQKQ